ncbi:MAG: hypothetical protein GTO55_07270 [Armatimonadetes bacterium]|nr:hypothetical protein [Armatimonadota bacterium]NIM24071.1 hypothetical protein [Armatimonadota bacterium]NIM67925.1 hypothetical protein [Armatimonadota bacterium]NIM76447.1 hypothetical protein [Armatimonadota bacterium]NIN06155.1 hypothetical protein [Armatimonadota bacterium]
MTTERGKPARQALWLILRVVISAALLIILVRRAGADQILRVSTQVPLWLILLFIVMQIALPFINGLGLVVLLRAIADVRTSTTLRFAFLSRAAGLLAPAQVGELAIVPLLSRAGVPLGQAAAVAVAYKVVTVGTIGLLAVGGLLRLLGPVWALRAAGLLAALVIILVITLAAHRPRQALARLVLRRHAAAFSGFATTLRAYAGPHHRYTLIGSLTALASLLPGALLAYLFFSHFQVPVRFLDMLLVLAILRLVGAFPITFGGIGLRQYVAVLLYEVLLIPGELAATQVLLLLVANYLIAMGVLWLLGGASLLETPEEKEAA